tara:strand:- start:1469 stop:1906 length:438 start_codon:yes stop_codon:yes gene_type:complete
MLDGYMLVRDLVPQVKETEDNLLKKFGSSFEGIKAKAAEMGTKLASVSKLFMGSEKGDDKLDEGTQGITPINVADVQGDKSGQINAVSTNASYEDGSDENVIISDSDSDANGDTSSNSNADLVIASSSDNNDDSTSADLFYKNAG